jgi:hypothetical protein
LIKGGWEGFITFEKIMSKLETPYIQYNTSNKDRARENRKRPTKAEEMMRSFLRKKQL